MKGIYQKLTNLSLAGIAIAGSLLTASQAALALTQQQILEKLDDIPVFLIVNEDGQSLTASVDTEESELQVPIVFINPIEAQAFIQDAESEQAEFADSAQIAVLPLSDVYAEASSQLENGNALVYVPSAESISQAAEIIDREIQGVPLYAAVDLERDQYLLTGEDTLPMFFSLTDLQAQLAALVESNPEVEGDIGVEVTTFEGVLQNMTSDNPEVNEFMERIQFVPASQILRSLQAPADSAE